jgi:predicted transcriptional regulator
MENEEGLEKLFFELASESRLGILRELQKKSFKMQKLARKLDLTDTEAFRQVQRLSESLLIQRQTDGAYTITQYGKLILFLSRSIDVAHKNRECFLTRDIWRLPAQFVERLGELEEAHLSTDMFDMFNSANQAIAKAEKYIWLIGDKPIPSMNANVGEKAAKGVKFRVLFHESLLPQYKPVLEEMNIIEKRTLSENIPATMVVTERVAGVSFLSIDGRADYVLFYGQDPNFMKWAHDLFLYYWERGKRCYPSATR